jgi:NAD(P)-dependent dehydrogenase (short-subunit alcohol dehydrogenase family)
MTNLAGKTVLITGGNTGIGQETAIALARDGARVVITSRDAERGEAAVANIRAQAGSDAVSVLPLDLANFASVRACAASFSEQNDRLDVLINNAGLILSDRRVTVDGLETTFQVNHLGHFLLTNLLRDTLVVGAPARVVNVSSRAHEGARHGLDFDDLQSTHRYRGFTAYGKSKLANILFTRELARRWSDTDIAANALHPGVVASRFGRDGDTGRMTRLVFPLLKPFALDAKQGAQTSVYVASAPELEGVTGGYWAKSAPATPKAPALDDAAARRLWEVSEQLVGL